MTTLTIENLVVTEKQANKSKANEIRELSCAELSHVRGGMKWQKGTSNTDVIDARGGQKVILGLTLTFDINGNVSSIS